MFGALGAVVLLVAFLMVGALLARLDALGDAAGGPLRSTARTVSDAADAFDRFGVSLTQAEVSSRHAAVLAGETAETLDALADALSVEIFGSQPLLPAAEGFRTASDQLAGLGSDLDDMSEALAANVGDVERASRNLRDVREQMNALLSAFGDRSDGDVGLASVALYALLAWLALLAVGCGVLGAFILRSQSGGRRR